MFGKQQIPKKSPEKRITKGTGFSTLIGLVSLLSGIYALLETRNIINLGFSITKNSDILAIVLIVCSVFLMKELAIRSSLIFAKRRIDSFI